MIIPQRKLHPMFAEIDDEAILRPEDVAQITGMSVESVRRWCRKGKLTNHSFGGKYLITGLHFKEFMFRTMSVSSSIKGMIEESHK